MPDNKNDVPEQRIFLRIPTKFSAQILVDGRLYGKASLKDLSSSGLSFYADEVVALPNFFEMRLRLPGHLKSIRVKLAMKYRKNINGMQKIGCSFAGISERDEGVISKYVARFMEFSLPSRVLGMAGFLLFVDGLCRLFAYLTNIYYIEAHPMKSHAAGHLYGVVLLAYTTASFLACIYSDNIKKKKFLLSFFCAAGAFLFLLLKNIGYLGLRLWQAGHPFVTTFLQAQFFLLAYAGVAIILYARSIKTIYFMANSIESHLKTYRTGAFV